jgi:hypothetical protein
MTVFLDIWTDLVILKKYLDFWNFFIHELEEHLWLNSLRTCDFLTLLAYRLNESSKFDFQIIREFVINYFRVASY